MIGLATRQVQALSLQQLGGASLARTIAGEASLSEDMILCEAFQNPQAFSERPVDEAIAYLLKSLEINPGLSHSYLLLGRAYCVGQRWPEAANAYEAYILARPLNPTGYLEVGFVYENICVEKQGFVDDVGVNLPFLPRCQTSEDLLKIRHAWENAMLEEEAFSQRGEEALADGDRASAIKWYWRAEVRSPGSGTPWFQIAQIYAEMGADNAAVVAYENAWDQGLEKSVRPLAIAYRADAEYKKAADLLRQALDMFSVADDRIWWYHNLGDSQRNLRDWEAALATYTLALEEFPADPISLVGIGWVVYEDRGDAGLASEKFNAAIAADLDGGDGYFALAQLHNREREYPEADLAYSLALQAQPNNPWWRLGWANSLRESSQLDRAVTMYRDLLDRSPAFDTAYVELAWTLSMQEKHGQAIEAIEEALTRTPEEKSWYYQRAGQVYERAGMAAEAINSYQHALSLDPDNTVANNGIQRLIGPE